MTIVEVYTRVHFLVFLMAMTQWPPILRCFKINETQVVDGEGGGSFSVLLVEKVEGLIDGGCVWLETWPAMCDSGER